MLTNATNNSDLRVTDAMPFAFFLLSILFPQMRTACFRGYATADAPIALSLILPEHCLLFRQVEVGHEFPCLADFLG